MRGPGIRLKYDVRRRWRCPACGYERQVSKREVTVRCRCTAEEPLMKLVEPQRKVRPVNPPLPPYVDFDELFPEDVSEGIVDEQIAGPASAVTPDASNPLSALTEAAGEEGAVEEGGDQISEGKTDAGI